jgi:hypothetical protein
MDSKLTDIFWTHTVHTMVHNQNRLMLRNTTDKNPYEIWKGRTTNVKHFRVFGRKCYIKREDGRMGKLTLVWTKSTCWLLKYNEIIQVLQFEFEQSCGKHQCNN